MRPFAYLLAPLLLAACSGAGPTATPATAPPPPTAPAAQPGPTPAEPAVAALVDFPNGTGPQSTGYDLALVGPDGKVAARAHAATRTPIATSGSGGGAAAVDLPEVSAANGRVYYLDGDQIIRFVAPNGSSGQVGTVPGSATAHATFAVSPDGQRIAIGVLTYSGTSATAGVFVQDLNGGGRRQLLESSSRFAWPVGWHGGEVVLAVSSSTFSQQGLTLNPYSAAGLELVDATNGQRTATIGGPDFDSACEVTGLPVPAGTACYHRVGTASSELWLLDWGGSRNRTLAASRGSATAALHPAGSSVAICCDASGVVQLAQGSAAPVATALKGSDSWPCWIDDQHVLMGSVNDHQFQPAILTAGSGAVATVDAHGFCAAVLGAAGGGQPNV